MSTVISATVPKSLDDQRKRLSAIRQELARLRELSKAGRQALAEGREARRLEAQARKAKRAESTKS